MRRVALLTFAALLAFGAQGCTPAQFLALIHKKEPSDKEILGIKDDRIRELDSEGLDAQTAQARNGLRLTIRTDKEAYDIGEPIIVDVRLENVTVTKDSPSGRDIPVYFEPVVRTKEVGAVEWLFGFRIHADASQRLIYRSPELRVPDAERPDYYHFVTLPPQSFVGRRFIFWPARVRALISPGTYGLLASYTVTEDSAYIIINRHFTAAQVELLGTKLAYARVWTGQVFSNRATFRVKRKKFLGLF